MTVDATSLHRLQGVSRYGLLAAIPLLWAATQLFEPARWFPLLVSLVLFGIPHGSLDLAVGQKLAGGKRSDRGPGFTALLFVGYVALAGLYLLVWFGAPALALGFFLLLTAWHWGSGDASWMARQGYGHSPGTVGFLLDAGWRGAFPMALPLLLHPEVTRSVLAGTLGLFGPVTGLEGLTLLLVSLGVIGAACLGLVLWMPAHRGNRLREAGMLVALFLILDPVAAIGLYFLFWHSLPHCGRLVDLLQPAARPSVGWFAPLVAIHRRGLPYTAGALAILGGLAVYLFGPQGAALNPLAVLGIYLVLLAIVTLPHAVVTACWDFGSTLSHTVVCSQSTPKPATLPVAQP
ncbi:MAG: Brp/Blh family beta-carotene 15,15'-dioxygenase [Opitutales bacterium]